MEWEKILDRLNGFVETNKLSELRGALMIMNVVDIAEFLSSLESDKMLKVFRILPKDISSDVFSYMDDEQRQSLMEKIGDKEIGELVSDMFVDDAVDFLEELPAGLVKRVLANVDEEQRKVINRFLRYPDYSAGSIMTIEFCDFHVGTTVLDAMKELKRTGVDKETIYTLYVIDEKRKLLGTVPLRRLILANDDAPIESLMNANFVCAETMDDQEHVVELVRKYDLNSIPVVDKEGRLVGIITSDDVMDVLEEEATEDIEKMNALLPSEEEYIKTGVFKLAKNRLPWLMFMMVSGIFTGLIIVYFENILTNIESIGVALTACIPMLMGTGGNCGSQASTLAIRGLAVGELEPKDVLKVLWKEFRVAAIVSVALAGINMLIQLFVFKRAMLVAFTVSIAMIFTVLLSKSIGCTLPMLAKKLKLDPALMAAPLITTIVDACSLLILFAFAAIII
ncbi:MAG: magnesium transporter [Clostridiales bacterium]|nr:magnesium transporter [Clostridiales bacterium]